MRILQVIPSLDPVAGGPVEAARQQAQVLGRRGHQVDTVSLDAPAPTPAEGAAAAPGTAGQGPVGAREFRIGSGRPGYGYSPALKPWLEAHVRHYDLIVVHGLWQYPGLCVRSVAMQAGIPYVVFTHGMLDPWFARRYPLKHLKKWLYWPWAEYRVLRDARAVLFTASEEQRLARESFWLYRARERVVGLGITDRPMAIGTAAAAFLAQHPELAARRCLLYLSRIHPKKGCDLLIRAFAEVASAQADLQLVLAGPDPTGWVPTLQALADELGVADRVSFTGMLVGEFKWGAYDHAEVFVLPSHQENFGIVVAEALASELPVLTTYKVNIWREIEEADAGYIAADDLVGTRQLLARWLHTDPVERVRMGVRARRCFEQHFEMEALSTQLEATYAEAADVGAARAHTFVGRPWGTAPS